MDGSARHPIVYFDGGGQGPYQHVCGQPTVVPTLVIRKWLDRQRLLGLVTEEGARAVEKLIGDLER